MKAKTNLKQGLHWVWSNYRMLLKSFIAIALIMASSQAPLHAQESQFTKPSWWFGAAGGANFNFHRGSTNQLNSDFTPPVVFHDGDAVGLYLAPLVEFYLPKSNLGMMLQVGYDSRKSSFEQVFTPCNCPADLSTNLSYITVEPSLRFAPFKSNFYLYGGVHLAYNLEKSFTYKLGVNPDYPEQVAPKDVTGDFSEIKQTLISIQIGTGYDIPLSSRNNQMQTVLSPFVSFHPYFGQSPRSIETWNITTLRVGAALKFGRGRKILAPTEALVPVNEVEALVPVNEAAVVPEVRFSVNAPKNILAERSVRETFPLSNYVYFDLGSNEIPSRYVLLTKDQVKNFKENKLQSFTPNYLSGRSDRQMIVYYNVLNILGDRLVNIPSSTISLVGSSEKGPVDAREMAESIKRYLVSVFAIDASRISIEGRYKPKIPSEQPGGTLDLELLREGDRRVTIESYSPALLMEFQSGPNAPLKPMEIIAMHEETLSFVTFNAEGGAEAFSSWNIEIIDEKGNVQYFGPTTMDKLSIPGRTILGNRSEGNYKVRMIGQTKSGETLRKETTLYLALENPPKNEEVKRFSIIYEFDESKAIAIYEKYLTEIVTPKIPTGGKVIIRGYTDIIGDAVYNQKLSLARANDVRNIIEKSLSRAGRSDVTFEVYAFGEDQSLSPFENKFPEERSYNRTVVIDIIPFK